MITTPTSDEVKRTGKRLHAPTRAEFDSTEAATVKSPLAERGGMISRAREYESRYRSEGENIWNSRSLQSARS